MSGPYGMQDGFANVYKFKTQSGKLRALRVFTRQMDPDIKFRYEKLGPYFKQRVKDSCLYRNWAIAKACITTRKAPGIYLC
jgi:hypothetical protein